MFMELAKYVLFHVIFLLGIYFMLCNISILLLYYSICLLDKMFLKTLYITCCLGVSEGCIAML